MIEVMKCAYCGKTRPIEEMKQGEIFHRATYYGKRVTERVTNWYCADSPCRGNDQMAQEG